MNPNSPSITYDISQLFDFIDQLADLSCLVYVHYVYFGDLVFREKQIICLTTYFLTGYLPITIFQKQVIVKMTCIFTCLY